MLALFLLAALSQDTFALVEEGQKRMREQAFAEAAALFEKAAEREPSSSRIHYYLGVSLMRLGRAGDAVSSLERAVALTPRTNLAVAYELGTAYLQTVENDSLIIAIHGLTSSSQLRAADGR